MQHNKRIRYAGRDYEIFWTSEHALHVCANFRIGTLHDIHHLDISQLLEQYVEVRILDKGRYVFLCWSGQLRCVYEVYVYLVEGGRNRPGRCVVLTGYRSNKAQYITAVIQRLRP